MQKHLRNFLHLIQNLFHNLLHNRPLPVLLLVLVLVLLSQPQITPLVPQFLFLLLPPRAPLAQDPPPLLHNRALFFILFNAVLFFKILGILAEVLADGFLLVAGEEGRGAGAPGELFEFFYVLFA